MDKEKIENNESLRTLSDEQLIESIRKTNNLHLSNIAQMAYANILSNKINLVDKIRMEEGLLNNLENDEQSFAQLFSKINDNIIKSNILEDIEKQDEKVKLDYYKQLRREIVKQIRVLSAYSTEISIVGEISGDFIYKDKIKNEFKNVPIINLSNFYNNVSSFLMKDKNLLKEKVMDITSAIPVRITKAKYYDIISKTLKRSLNNSNRETIETILKRYKAVFNGSLESEYGLYFNKYFLISQECKSYDFSSTSIENLKDIYEKSYNVIAEIGKAANILMNFGVIVNQMIVLYSLKKYMLNDNIKHAFKVIESCIDKYNEDNSEDNKNTVFKEINKFVKDIESDFNDNNNRLQELSIESFKRKLEIHNPLKDELLLTQQCLAYLSDYALEKDEIMLSDQNDLANKEYLDQVINALIQFLDRNIKNMSVLQRRIRMRRLLALTDFPFENPDEFFNYLSSSIEMTSDKTEQFAIINKVSELMQSYN